MVMSKKTLVTTVPLAPPPPPPPRPPKRLPSAESLVAPPTARVRGRLARGSAALPAERRVGVAGASPKADAVATSATRITERMMEARDPFLIDGLTYLFPLATVTVGAGPAGRVHDERGHGEGVGVCAQALQAL